LHTGHSIPTVGADAGAAFMFQRRNACESEGVARSRSSLEMPRRRIAVGFDVSDQSDFSCNHDRTPVGFTYLRMGPHGEVTNLYQELLKPRPIPYDQSRHRRRVTGSLHLA